MIIILMMAKKLKELSLLLICLLNSATFKAMPHGSEKSSAKNRNEIRHSLCMPHCSDKSWRIIKKMTHKNLNIVKKTSLSI